jgi:hypothetical protein
LRVVGVFEKWIGVEKLGAGWKSIWICVPEYEVVVSQSRNWFMHSNRLFTVVNCFLHSGWSLRLWLLVAGLLFVTVTKSCFCTVG